MTVLFCVRVFCVLLAELGDELGVGLTAVFEEVVGVVGTEWDGVEARSAVLLELEAFTTGCSSSLWDLSLRGAFWIGVWFSVSFSTT